jgi:type II secretion system protein J
MTGYHRKASAFTLLEVLVATTLISILAGSLYATLSIAFKARRSAIASVEPVRKADLTLGLLGEDLRSAAVPNGRLAGPFAGQDGTDDRGHDSDSLAFYGTTRSPEAAEGIGDIQKVELLCEPSDDGETQVLVRCVTTNLLSPTTVEPQREILCRSVYAFNLRYFDGSDWLDTWDSTTVDNVLPSAIEVTLQLNDDRQKDPNIGGYRLSQVFLLPCGPAPSASTLVVKPSS